MSTSGEGATRVLVVHPSSVPGAIEEHAALDDSWTIPAAAVSRFHIQSSGPKPLPGLGIRGCGYSSKRARRAIADDGQWFVAIRSR